MKTLIFCGVLTVLVQNVYCQTFSCSGGKFLEHFLSYHFLQETMRFKEFVLMLLQRTQELSNLGLAGVAGNSSCEKLRS